MTLECRGTKLWPISFLGASQCLSTLKGGAKPTQTEHTPQSTPLKLKRSKWMDHANQKKKKSPNSEANNPNSMKTKAKLLLPRDLSFTHLPDCELIIPNSIENCKKQKRKR
jgi:hypothetical protein